MHDASATPRRKKRTIEPAFQSHAGNDASCVLDLALDELLSFVGVMNISRTVMQIENRRERITLRQDSSLPADGRPLNALAKLSDCGPVLTDLLNKSAVNRSRSVSVAGEIYLVSSGVGEKTRFSQSGCERRYSRSGSSRILSLQVSA